MKKVIFTIVGGTIAVIGLTWIVQGNDFYLYKYWAPKQEAARREVWEQTKSYNQGMIQELQNMQFEYVKATPSQKASLRSIILHRAADFPEDRMPSDLRLFITQLKGSIQ